MVVVILILAPESTKGVVSRYLMEISSGVFIGNIKANIREELWDFVRGNLGKGSLIMAHSDNSVMGHQIRTQNINKRTMKSLDGIELIYIENSATEKEFGSSTGWSKQSKFLRRR